MKGHSFYTPKLGDYCTNLNDQPEIRFFNSYLQEPSLFFLLRIWKEARKINLPYQFSLRKEKRGKINDP